MLPEADSSPKHSEADKPSNPTYRCRRRTTRAHERHLQKGPKKGLSPSERHPPPRTPHRPDLTRKELFSFRMADFSPFRRFSSLRTQELLKEKAPSDEGAFFLQRDQFSHLPFT